MKINRKGQEEIVGFALIVVIVAIILLFLVSFYIRGNKDEGTESYEVESFIQSFLGYTTSCEDFTGNLSIQRLISECNKESLCSENIYSCDLLDSTLRGISEEGWRVGEDRPIGGYELHIEVNNKNLMNITQGILEGNFKGSSQDIVYKGDSIKVSFRAYYN